MAATKKVLKEVVNSELEMKLKAYKEFKIMQEQVKDQLSELESDIRGMLSEMGETSIACGSYKCSISESSRENFNKSIIKENYPELYEACVTRSSYTRFLVK